MAAPEKDQEYRDGGRVVRADLLAQLKAGKKQTKSEALDEKFPHVPPPTVGHTP